MKSMLKYSLVALAVVGLTACNQEKSAEPNAAAAKVELKTDVQKQGYGIGASVGRYVAQHVKEQKEMGFDVDQNAIVAGFTESLNGNSAMTDDEIKSTLEALDKSVNEKRQAQAQAEAEKNQAAGKAFLEQNKAKDGVKTTESGLQYEVLQAGSGDSPKAEDTVKVKYTGKLIDGTVFDSTEKNGGEPIEFPLNRVIPGWTEGLQLMSKGAKFRFVIPAELAYGERAMGDVIPANSTLEFEVELLDFHAPAATDAAAQ
ncbi:FKBP-type peptidyl-prolyl cis-trans isomerase [Shewanella sp.]|uniref:FKBP-type peptidyl-prolyl cis-trans isomerase n=1 Tax=Shewanella sp. TaxID=50422 RepID=UPI003A96B58A